jgi:PAS domain S-box-containing protein
MPETILIVDDNPANLKVARIALESEGFAVRVAVDGEEALAILSDLRPGLILMDLQLPGIDGLALTRQLKADPATADIPIIAVTSYAMKGDREKALEAGCDGYIAKPIDPIGLPDTVRSHLRAAPGTAEAPPVSASATTAARDPVALRHTILVIEDNPTTLKVMRLTLERQGYNVLAAPDAASALDATRQVRPDLIIQDLMLPDMDGIALAQRLHERFEAEPVPIVCISGLLTRPDESRAVRGGFAAVIVKPIDPFQLLEVVRFHLSLPPESGLKGEDRRVLVVDDDPVLLKLARLWLTNAGFNVFSASNGQQAIEVARRENPDIILSDVMMPGMDGFELCFAIRTDARLSRIPVVLTSAAYGEEDDRLLAQRVGASALVPRTEGIDDVAAALISALEQPLPPVPTTSISSLQQDHTQRALWQLERQIRQNAGLARRVTLQATQLSVLAGVAEALAGHRAIETVLGDVLAACLDMAGISRGVLYLRDDHGALQLIHQIGYSDAEFGRLRTFFGREDLLLRVSGSSAVAAFPSSAFPASIADALLRDADVTSLLVVPVVWADEVYGAMLLGARTADITGEDALAFARVLGSQLGQAVGLSRAFRSLAVSEKRFRTLVESMEDSVVIVDPDGRITGAWGRHLQRDDIDSGAWVGLTVEELAPAQAPAHHQAHERALNGEVTTYEWSLPTEARTLHYQSIVSPVQDHRGAVTSVLRVTRDISDEKRLHAQLMVSDRVVTIGTLAAGVAHEINNPLTAVVANLDLIMQSIREPSSSAQDVRVTADISAMLVDAVDAAARVREIVRDLKMLSRAEEDTRDAVDLHRVLDSSLRMAWNEIRHRARVTKLYGDVPLVDANESRLGQVFLNLLINAAQAIPAGHADTNEIRITTMTRQDGLVCAEVRDSGSGIPPEIVERIFDPFFTTKPAGIGTGLGLAICRRIVNSLGGEIEVEGAPGTGTTFRVLLPPTHEAPTRSAVAPAAPRAATRRGRILLVDDDQHVGAIVRRIIGTEHDILVLDNAQTALERIRAGDRFDLIFCDLMMPVVTGMEFHEALMRFHPDQAAVVVFLTGGAFTASARAFLDDVANPWLEKPFQVDELRAFVNARLA